MELWVWRQRCDVEPQRVTMIESSENPNPLASQKMTIQRESGIVDTADLWISAAAPPG